jgi:hypothetical protein
MSDLIAFLTARIDEDEQRALAMKHFTVHEQPYYSCAASRTGPLGDLEWGEEFCDCFVAERKARALREVEAKRKILYECRPRPGAGLVHEGIMARRILYLLASVYSDHPDYDPDWQS